jgi:hypothetical protein
VKQGDEFLLQVAAQIDQGASATDEIEFGERRIFDDVLLGKDQHVADTFVYPVSAAGRIYKKSVPGVASRSQW